MQRHWKLVYKGGRDSCHREDKEQEEAEEARSLPAGDEEKAEAVAWALEVIVCARIAERSHPMRGVRRVLRSNALNAALP